MLSFPAPIKAILCTQPCDMRRAAFTRSFLRPEMP